MDGIETNSYCLGKCEISRKNTSDVAWPGEKEPIAICENVAGFKKD